MNDAVIARRYAEALFSLSRREGGDAAERHGQCLAGLAGMIGLEPRLAQTLKSPVVSIAEKKAVLKELLKYLDSDVTMSNFCNLLADKGRLGALLSIERCYRDLLDASRGVVRGKVTTAIQLTPAKQDRLREELKKRIGSDIELQFDVDAEILGGMVLAVGDKVLDSSLRAQLGILRKSLIRGM